MLPETLKRRPFPARKRSIRLVTTRTDRLPSEPQVGVGQLKKGVGEQATMTNRLIVGTLEYLQRQKQ